MNNLSIYISNTLVPSEVIREYPKSQEKLSFDGKVIPDSIEITLDNIDRTEYDDRYPGSLFYGSTFYGDPVEIYDNDLGTSLFQGILVDIQADDGSGTLKIEASNYLRKLSDTPCVHANSSDKTPAEIIYEVLTDATCGNFDASTIVYGGFQESINIQTANSAFINDTFTADNNKNCLAVINELLRMSCCEMYSKQNLIYLKQWQEYNGEIGTSIEKRHVISGTYKHYYEDKYVYNSCSIAYDNAGTAAYVTDSDATSIARFGKRAYNVPDEDVDSTTSTDFNIIYRNATGAAWIADLILTRFSNFKKYSELSISDDLYYVELGEQFDLNWTPFIREPVRLIERELDKNSGLIKCKVEFLNLPEEYYDRDVTAPDPVELIAAIASSSGTVVIKFTKNLDTDWLGYRIYFSSTPGVWYSEICNYGQSPIDCKSTALSDDGYIYYIISQLDNGTEYFFKITTYDTSFNESEFSNMLSATPETGQNEYRVTGNLATGYSLDQANNSAGTAPDEWLTWGEAILPITLSPAACYESSLRYKDGGFSIISWRGVGTDNNITFQHREGDTPALGSWSTAINAIGNNSVVLTKEYMQYRFNFNCQNWTDTDYFYIKEIL